MKSVVVLLAAVMMLGACTGTTQDPLAGAPDVIRDGKLPDTNKPVSEKPLPKEALQIDAPGVVNGRVGMPVEFKVTGRVMVAGVDSAISFDNISEFPGATFNVSTGIFSWVPAKGAVGSAPSAEYTLRISLATVANPSNPTVSVEKKNVVLVIVNSYAKPIVNYITGDTNLQAGRKYTMNFEVEDQDAMVADDVSMVVRDCVNSYYSDSIAHYVDMPTKVKAATTAGKYTGSLVLDLSMADTVRTGDYCFAISAVSKFGVMSQAYVRNVSIEAKVRNTKITNAVAEVPAGQALRFGFSIYDPTGTGIITIKSLGNLSTQLPGSSITCGNSASGIVDCVATIDATNLQPAVYTTDIVTENKSNKSNTTVQTTHTLRINVKAQ